MVGWWKGVMGQVRADLLMAGGASAQRTVPGHDPVAELAHRPAQQVQLLGLHVWDLEGETFGPAQIVGIGASHELRGDRRSEERRVGKAGGAGWGRCEE